VRVPRTDLILAAALALLAQAEIWLAGTVHGPKAVVVLASLVACGALVVRRRLPLVSAALVLACGAVTAAYNPASAEDDSQVGLLLLLITAYSVGAYARGRAAVAGALLVAGLVAALVLTDPDEIDAAAVVFFAILLGLPYAGGLAIARRRGRERLLERHADRLDRERELATAAAIAEERTRIARELHDIVAHSVSVIVVQAQGGRRMLRLEPDEAEAAFDAIETTGRAALAEMRRLLGMLRAPDEDVAALAPQPSLEHLDVLVDHVRAAGLAVELELEQEGEAAAIPPGVDLSAYRIVQEALTNALKHAGPAHAHVRVRRLPAAVDIEVYDDGDGFDTPAAPGAGQGMVGMRERVSVYGGTIDAGARPGGGYLVRVRLPFGETRP
jgi:signal transduction histidine kinase